MRPTIITWSRLGLGLVVIAVVMAACGSDDTDEAAETGETASSSSSSSMAATTAGPTSTSASTSSTNPSSGQSHDPDEAPSPSSTTTTAGRTSATPDRGLVDVRAVPITSVTEVGSKTLEVVVEGGIEPCFIVDRVDRVETDDEVELTVNAGSEPGAVCIQIVELHTVTVELDRPLGDRRVIDGATGLPV